MRRIDRLQEAREALWQNFQDFYKDQNIPARRVRMDLLLVDLIDELVKNSEEDRASLLEPARFTQSAEYIKDDMEQVVQETLAQIMNKYQEEK